MLRSRFIGSSVLGLAVGSLLAAGCASTTAEYTPTQKEIIAKQRMGDYADRVAHLEHQNTGLRHQYQSEQQERQMWEANFKEAQRQVVDWGKYDLTGGENGNLTLAGDLTFRSGSHSLSTGGQQTLAKVARALLASSASHVRVEGHTDSDPISKSGRRYADNLHLSIMRAHAVATYLITKGVQAKQVSVSGFGANKPVSSSAKKVNRRVEIKAFHGDDAPVASAQ
jgi:flagellar motor protein MotB